VTVAIGWPQKTVTESGKTFPQAVKEDDRLKSVLIVSKKQNGSQATKYHLILILGDKVDLAISQKSHSALFLLLHRLAIPRISARTRFSQ